VEPPNLTADGHDGLPPVRAEDSGAASLGQVEDQPDKQPDDKEKGENPEQERRLTDPQPREFPLVQEEACTPHGNAPHVVLEDLSANSLGGIVSRAAVTVGVYGGTTACPRTRSRLSHGGSVPETPGLPNRRPIRLWDGGEQS
jgi:hypothetical protein